MIVAAVLGVVAVVVAARVLQRRGRSAPAPVDPVVADREEQASSWFDAPLPTETSTPPMGIPTSAPERLPGAAALAVPAPVVAAPVVAAPVVSAPAVPGPTGSAPVGPVGPAGSAEITDPALRIPPGLDPRLPGHGSAEATDRIPVATLAAAAPPGGSLPAGSFPAGSPPAAAAVAVPPPGAAPAGSAAWSGAVGPGVPPSGAPAPGTPVPGHPTPGHPTPGTLTMEPVTPGPAPRPAHRWGLGAYLVAEAVFLVASGLMGLLLVAQDPVTAGSLAAALAVPTVAAALVGLLVTRLRGNGPVVDLQLRPTARDVGLGFAFGFGGLFLTIPASLVYVSVVGEDASSAVGDIFGDITAGPGVALLIVAIVVLVAPLCEEILYRGLLWGGLTRLGANRWLAFAVTTVIFALAHFEWPRALLLLVVALPLGLARVYSDGLLAPVIAHQINNLLPGIGLYLMLTGAFPAL
ncbi:hypothetical protein GCM10017691_14770 [Pseudonocardia petroleophila]